MGILLIGISGSLSAFGLLLLSKCAAYAGREASFFNISKITYPSASIWFDFAIAIKCFGVSISYLVIIGDLMPKVLMGLFHLDSESIFLSRTLWITLFMGFITPISFLKSLHSLRHTSSIALCSVFYLLMLVLFYGFFPPENLVTPPPDEFALVDLSWNSLTVIPIFIFAFTCHQNLFSVHNELEDNSAPYMNRVITTSISIAFYVYQFIGITGYMTFGKTVGDNILAKYPASPAVTIGQFALVILFLLSYPLQAHPCRVSLDKVMSSLLSSSSANGLSLSSQATSAIIIPQKRFFILTTSILIGSYLMAVSVSSLGFVLALVGATGSTTICYILPGLFYYKIRKNIDAGLLPNREVGSSRNASVFDRTWNKVLRVGSLVLVVWGFVIMFVSLGIQFFDTEGGGAH